MDYLKEITSQHTSFLLQREFLQAHERNEVRIQEGQMENKI
jgi:hypothetical protein